jgi:hypothetical protein
MSKGIIHYDKTERKWLYDTPTGLTKIFEGPGAKFEAQKDRLKTEVKAIAELIDSMNPGLHKDAATRCFNAGLIIADGNVISPTEEEKEAMPRILARVGNSKSTVEYLVSNGMGEHLYICTCPDWNNGLSMFNLPPLDPNRPSRGAPHIDGAGVVCKHAFAVHLNNYTQRAMSIQNPASESLANKLWDILMKEYNGTALSDLLLTMEPVSFGRGKFVLKGNEQSEAYFQIMSDDLTAFKQNVSAATSNSQILEMIQ